MCEWQSERGQGLACTMWGWAVQNVGSDAEGRCAAVCPCGDKADEFALHTGRKWHGDGHSTVDALTHAMTGNVAWTSAYRGGE